MKCQILFSGKNTKIIINVSSAELAQRMVKIKDVHLLETHKQYILVLSIFAFTSDIIIQLIHFNAWRHYGLCFFDWRMY